MMSESGHFIKKCSVCGKVIAQCRCMCCDKPVLPGLCEECKKKGEKS